MGYPAETLAVPSLKEKLYRGTRWSIGERWQKCLYSGKHVCQYTVCNRLLNTNMRDADPTAPTPVEPARSHGSLKWQIFLLESSLPSPSPNALPEGVKVLWTKKTPESMAQALNVGTSPEARLNLKCWQHHGRPAQTSSPRAHRSLWPVLQSSYYVILFLLIPFTGSKVLIKHQHHSRAPVGKPETVNTYRHESPLAVCSGDELQLIRNY